MTFSLDRVRVPFTMGIHFLNMIQLKFLDCSHEKVFCSAAKLIVTSVAWSSFNVVFNIAFNIFYIMRVAPVVEKLLTTSRAENLVTGHAVHF